MSSGNISHYSAASSLEHYDRSNNLDFNDLKLYGRDGHIATLKKAYQQSFTSCQVVWLRGDPGVGKSSLVEHLFLLDDCYYCCGKFERLRPATPYSALTQLLAKLCHRFEFDGRLVSSLSADDATILSNLVPELPNILEEGTPSSLHNENVGSTAREQNTTHLAGRGNASSSSSNPEWGLERLKQALRAFIKEVCSVLESPLIMFLDDLQWADIDTLDIIMDLLSDTNIKGLLFVGSFRDNEAQGCHHPLIQCIQAISEDIPSNSVSELHLTNLDEAAIRQLTADLLSTRPEEVEELSKLVYSKTDGNCFYTIQVLRHIHEKKLLYISRSTMKWEWDADAIKEEVHVSDNVAEFMLRKLQMLPQPTVDALTLSAFMGTKVQIAVLESLLPLMIRPTPDTPVLTLLEPAVKANLIEINGPNGSSFKFTHDRVTAAAYDMVPEGARRKKMHLQIGWQLVAFEKPSGTESERRQHQWQTILAVDQLNRGADLITDKRDQARLARLDLIAAQQVLQTGAFKLARGLLEIGIDMLGEQRWKRNYDLTLPLSVTLASVLYSNGQMEESLHLVEETLLMAKCPDDKYEAHSIQLKVLESTGRIEECMEVGTATLVDLGFPQLPKRPHLGHIVLGVFGAKRALRRMTDGDILSLPTCTDTKRNFIMCHLNALCYIAYFASRDAMMVVAAYRVLQMSLQVGLTRYSSYAFACHACAMAEMGDLEGSFRFAELSLRLMERFPTNYSTAAVVYGMLHHLKKPIHECITTSLTVYLSAFSKGDLQSAGLACVMHCVTRYAAGTPLDSIAKDGFAFCSQLEKYQQFIMLKYLLIPMRAVLELTGRSNEMSKLVENAESDEKFEAHMAKDGDMNRLNIFWLRAMEIRFYLGDMDSALDFAEKNWRTKKPSGFQVFSAANLLFSALTALQEWKRNRRRRHWRLFRKWHRELGTWVEKGCVNTSHLMFLLDAELMVVQKKHPDKIRSMFESSISRASRTGLVHDAALASERAGVYFLELRDMYWAEHYMANAYELYTDWNATAKVRQMEQTYGTLIHSNQESASISFDNRTPVQRRQSNFSVTGRSRLEIVAQVESEREDFSRIMEPAGGRRTQRP